MFIIDECALQVAVVFPQRNRINQHQVGKIAVLQSTDVEPEEVGRIPSHSSHGAGDQFTSGYSKAVKAVASETEVYVKVTDAAIASITAGEVVIGLRIIDLAKFA